ncbi:MAG: Transposon Tn7 transposition protein TnsC [Nitrospira sp. OLB3]|nr:MAG: Transposon Tn7 transposition protein TnsC [Nitrospira sp. OLB3]
MAAQAGFNRGQRCKADYRKTGNPEFDGNPLIETLPPTYENEEIAQYLSYKPVIPDGIRRWPKEKRLELITPQIRSIFQPLSPHFSLARRVSQSIRTGYVLRNPFGCPNELHAAEERLKRFTPGLKIPPSLQTAPLGFALIGMSGMGKTTSLVAILQGLYPQVVDHEKYNGRRLLLKQVPWLILSCPSDGASLKELCKNFFRQIDSLADTKYESNYSGATAEELGRGMAFVAKEQALGLLVIDEIQFLCAAKSGGDDRLLNFLVQLVNTLGIPVVTVGTYSAMKALGKEMLHIRRAGGIEGEIIWDNWLSDSSDFQFLVNALFEYQYVKHPVALSPTLIETLYDVTQGITDYMVKVFTAAQVRAIVVGQERITVDIIRSVARDLLRQAGPFLTALLKKDKSVLLEMEDAVPIDLDEFMTREIRKKDQSAASKTEPPKKNSKSKATKRRRHN